MPADCRMILMSSDSALAFSAGTTTPPYTTKSPDRCSMLLSSQYRSFTRPSHQGVEIRAFGLYRHVLQPTGTTHFSGEILSSSTRMSMKLSTRRRMNALVAPRRRPFTRGNRRRESDAEIRRHLLG